MMFLRGLRCCSNLSYSFFSSSFSSSSSSSSFSSMPGSPKVCVVGSGMGGLATVRYLLKLNSRAEVDVLEKLPIPFGLIRYGVAPDHGAVKNCMQYLTDIAESQRCRFIGNVALGQDISLAQLQHLYDAVVLAYGAQEDYKLGIPGEDLSGVYSAKSFYGWYNGFPMYRDLNPDLSGDVAVIIGQGNVALDVARILLTPTELLESTDICSHALQALRRSGIRRVHLIGRQGPLQVSFSTKELRHMAQKIPGCRFRSDPAHMEPVRRVLTDLARPKKRLVEAMMKVTSCGQESEGWREWVLHFARTPVELMAGGGGGGGGGRGSGDGDGGSGGWLPGKVSAIRLEINKLEEGGRGWRSDRFVGTGEFEELPCSMVLRSIGYRAPVVPDVPSDPSIKTIPNREGRVVATHDGEAGSIAPGLYCSGWVRTGPAGAVLNTMSSGYHTAEMITEDHQSGKLRPADNRNSDISEILDATGVFTTSLSDWKLINAVEQDRCKANVKPREKITSFEEMIKIIKDNRGRGGWTE